MAYLNINKLAEGRVFKGTVRDKYGNYVEHYVKMVNNNIVRSDRYNGIYNPVISSTFLTSNSWVEVKEVIKSVPALTELAKALLEIPETRVAISFGSMADSKQFLEALENSTNFTWITGVSPTKSSSFNTRNEVIFLHNNEKEITWGLISELTSNSRKTKHSLYLDYDLMATELVEIIKIKEVK